MKSQLHLLTCDWSLVVEAMEDYRKNLGGYELYMFDIAYRNVYNQKEHDGQSFKYIIAALTESDSDTDNLILWVENALVRHQRINGPRNKGTLLSRAELMSLPLKGVMRIAN